MNQKVLQNVWLRVCMIVAVVTTAFAGTAWADGNTPTPITVELAGFSAYNGQTGQIEGLIDGNISFSTTGGSVSDSKISAITFTLTAAKNAKINSVSFHYASWGTTITWSATNIAATGSFDANVGGTEQQKYPEVTELNCEEIVFNAPSEWNKIIIDYISVTYTPGTPDYTITALSSDTNKGTVELNGNVIVATPKSGYAVDENNPYTRTEGSAVVTYNGFKYITVVPSSNCTIVINFVPHAGDMILDFEHSSNADWICQGFERVTSTNPNPHGGSHMGSTTGNTASIQTTAKVGYPKTFSCHVCPTVGITWGTTVTWKVEVSSDGTNWRDVNNNKKVLDSDSRQGVWVEFTVDLSSETNVYVRLSCTGTNAAVDDIKLTTNAAPVGTELSVNISSVGYATFTPEYNVSLPTGLKAYKVTGATRTSVTMEEIGTNIPRNTPVVLKGSEAKTYYLPIIESADANVSGNLLQVSNGSVTGDGSTIFVLANLSKGVGFYRMASGQTIPKGKAYLEMVVIETKEFYGFEEDGATGIEKTLSDSPLKGENIYNLAGQRINKLQKGINIVNGKKILF